MKHASIPLETPIEIISMEPSEFSPLISKCQIKVCWVGDEANRNESVITKQVARDMAHTLRGAAIVGYYNEVKEDFEQHNKILEIRDNELAIRETTRPYGFVDLGAKVWFQYFLDDDGVQREYLVTEGWLWTGQYPECSRIVEKGNGHSMELDNDRTKGFWTNSNNSKGQLFIINESVISKLCILGEDVEPCFEGANITNTQFSFNPNFAQELYSLMADIKEILSKGGKQPMYNVYAVEIGSNLWNNIYSYLVDKYPVEDAPHTSQYSVEGIYEEEEQKFFVVAVEDNKYLKFNFSEEEFAVEEPVELGEDFQPQEIPQFDAEAVKDFISNFVAENQGKEEQEEQPKFEEPMKEEKPAEEEEENPSPEESAPAYSLDEIPEYQEALARIAALEQDYSAKEEEVNTLNGTIATLNEELTSLREFKNTADRKEKQTMIDGFYMLSEEDKKDVIEHIDEYSLNDIESRLSIICVRNKVSFAVEENGTKGPTTYSFEESVDTTPDWIKAVLNTEKELNKI